MTTETRPEEPGFSGRDADARSEVESFRQGVTQKQAPIRYRNVLTGGRFTGDMDIVSAMRNPETGKIERIKAPRLSPEEEMKAMEALRGALEAGQVRYPELANQMLTDPSKLWLLGEIQMMLSPGPNEVSYDFTADLMEGLTTTTGQRARYEHETAHEETQQLFWHEIGSKYSQEDRVFLTDVLAQLEAQGANKVGALALAWAQDRDLEDEDTKAQLFLNVANWAFKEQEHQMGKSGFFGGLESLQDIVEYDILSPLINAGVGLISGPEEAARRRHLTIGQQAAYSLGLRPPEEAGDFGWWAFVSGGVDALTEIGADPLAWVAGIGLGVKAAKTIPLAQKATKAGRAVAAARAILPKPLTGASRRVGGGRFARITYSLTSKNVDELLERTLRNGVADDAMTLIQQGNMSKFQRLYPHWRNLSDTAVDVIQNSVKSPEEFIEVLKADALSVELLKGGDRLADLTSAAQGSERALRRQAGEVDDVVEGIVDDGATLLREVAERPDDFIYHATSAKGDAAIRADTFGQGTWAHSREVAENYYRSHAGELGDNAVIQVYRKSDLPPNILARVQKNIDEGGDVTTIVDRLPPMFDDLGESVKIRPHLSYPAREGIETVAEGRRVATFAAGPDGSVQMLGQGQTHRRMLSDLIADDALPRDLRLQAAKDKLRLNTFNNRGGPAFILADIPAKSKRVFSWQKALEGKGPLGILTRGSGRVGTFARRTAARVTPGRIPDEIRLFDSRKGADDLRRLGEHFGIRQDSLDDMISEFIQLERGARQEWVWDTFLRQVGRETGVPAFEHQLIQFYKGGGIRNFSATGIDLLTDGKRIPVLPSQFTTTLPVPVEELTQVFRRAQSIGNRSKLARAMGFNGRGLGKTKGRRMELVQRLRHQLGDQAKNMSDEQLYDMAFSMVSPNAGMDARGVVAGRMAPFFGTGFNKLHGYFTRSMLVLRPIQWMWRVAILEEPIRAHLFNMPSIYSNPFKYMARAREAHYMWNVNRWAEANMSWGRDVLHTLTQGGRQRMIDRVTELGLADDVFGGNIPKNTRAVHSAIEKFVENALYGRTRPNKLSPVKRVPWAVKNRAHSIKTAERAIEKMGGPVGFNLQEGAEEIAMRLVSGYLGESVGANHRKLYQWTTGMTQDEAFTHGRVWGSKLIEFSEDQFGRAALRRRAAILRGETPDVTGADLVNSGRWELMAPDLRMKYANETSDIVIAERYLDEMLAREIDHLFAPFLDSMGPNDLANLLDEFATTRRISGNLSGQKIDWDLTGGNYGAGVRQVGDFTAAARQDAALRVPSDLPAPSMDGRFMAEDPKGYVSRMANWVLETFGEDATQTLNRRPAWVAEYRRWMDNYTNVGVPTEVAQKLAQDNANQMINYVMFNMQEAPYYVARLNKVLPFFGATYEVMATWSYKMPVAVGGTWPTGVGETARKFDRLIDGFVNMGLLDREENRDGTINLTLNLVPPDNDKLDVNELGAFLQGAGFKAVNTLDQAISTILNMEEGLELRSQGYRLAAGHPLNPSDYGMLSFAMTDVGVNPATNLAVSALAARIPGAAAPRQDVVREGESLADVAHRLEIDVNDLVRYNREIFVDTDEFGSTELYNGILSGEIDPETLQVPGLTVMNVPGSSLWDAFADTFMPFGQVTNPHEFAVNFIPGSLRWVMAGIALQNQPSDSFWADNELGGIFGGVLPDVNQAQMASQLNEAFMFLEAHDLVDGKGPFTRIMEKEAKLQGLLDAGKVDEANALRAEIKIDTEAFLDRAQKSAAESLIMRGMTGQFLPTTPGHVRREEELIREFWDTREYADSIAAGEGVARLQNFKSMEEVDRYKGMLAAWLQDPKGDRARATFHANNPQLMAYLTPKTFYKHPLPQVDSYEEYQRQIQSGEREPSPLHISMWRARSASIQADYYNKYIAEFGNDPLEAAANAMFNRERYQELNDERSMAYQALEMWDDMHGSVYATHREETYGDVENWAQDQINDKLNKVRDNLGILLELEDNFDVELDLAGIADLNSSVRGAIAELSKAIREFRDLSDETNNRNAYEEAVNQYFEQVYIPYSESISELYDQLPEVADSERQSLIYEQIKFLRNEQANTTVFLDGNTSVPFPNPLEYSWQGKADDERQVKMQQWMTRPVAWMDQDQASRIVETAPHMAEYLPTEDHHFDIYRNYTLRKIEVDEMFEANEITRSVRNKAIKNLDEQLRRMLIEQGRGKEVEMMDMTPYEKLELSGMLPPILSNYPINDTGGILSEAVRYTRQALEAAGETPGTIAGRHMVEPLQNLVENAFYRDPQMKLTLTELGVNLQDKTAMDSFLNWLFFGYSGER